MEKATRNPVAGLLAALMFPMAAIAQGLVVHEWGTFTTLTASSGQALANLYVDASRLPAFVEGLPFFNFDSTRGWPAPDNLRHVTVKMETPILYFYSPVETDVEAEVKFQGGTISQWYPRRFSGEDDPSGPAVDFSTPRQGSIAWKAKVLAPSDKPAYTTSPGLETQEWTAPRATQANLLRGQAGEIEKFLFYRGLGNFSTPVEVKFTVDGKLSIVNRGTMMIAHAMVYELPREAPMGFPPNIWWEGELAPSQQVLASRPDSCCNFALAFAAIQRLRQATVEAGLFQDEADAMFRTWENSYFAAERGLKLFWIVPREDVDRILPLKIAPLPETLERVIIGRNDILTPEFERELIRASESGGLKAYANDKYYLAYLDFLTRNASTGTRQRSGYPRNGLRDGSSRSLSFLPYRMPWVVEADAASSPRRAWDVGGRSVDLMVP